MRVLVVDDSPLFLMTLVELLERLPGVEVTGLAGSAQEGLIAASRSIPDVVLLDLMLPDMNGLEAVFYLKLIEPAPAVILMSLFNGPEYREMARVAGADGFIAKDALAEKLPAFFASMGDEWSQAAADEALAWILWSGDGRSDSN